MIKINYPSDPVSFKAFTDQFLEKLRPVLGGDLELQKALAKVRVNGSPLTWEVLLTSPFADLIDLNAEILKKRTGNIKRLKPLTSYKTLQKYIARFFTEQEQLKLNSCFYCNIDTVYSFSLIGDYRNGIDFINRAMPNELIKFHGIGPLTRDKIINKRKSGPIVAIDKCGANKAIVADLQSFKPGHTHNHFTLDHYLHQAEYPYLSLCLFNFVPSCYVCNSKYKGDRRLYKTNPASATPSSSVYSFPDDVIFKLFYHRQDKKISSKDDYSVELEPLRNQDSHEVYIETLNIRGRYNIHKHKAQELIEKQEDYPDTRIKQLSIELKKPMDEIRRQIFGADLYDREYDNSPLVKYKRDIAKNIKLLP